MLGPAEKLSRQGSAASIIFFLFPFSLWILIKSWIVCTLLATIQLVSIYISQKNKATWCDMWMDVEYIYFFKQSGKPTRDGRKFMWNLPVVRRWVVLCYDLCFSLDRISLVYAFILALILFTIMSASRTTYYKLDVF